MLTEVQLIWVGWAGPGQIQICPMYPYSGAHTEGALWSMIFSWQMTGVQEAKLRHVSPCKASVHIVSTNVPCARMCTEVARVIFRLNWVMQFPIAPLDGARSILKSQEDRPTGGCSLDP